MGDVLVQFPKRGGRCGRRPPHFLSPAPSPQKTDPPQKVLNPRQIEMRLGPTIFLTDVFQFLKL